MAKKKKYTPDTVAAVEQEPLEIAMPEEPAAVIEEPKVEEKLIFKKAISNVNIRKGPSLSAEIDSVLLQGCEIRVIEDLGEWTKVCDDRYIMSQYLQ